MEPLRDPVFLAWMASWEAKGNKIVAVDTTTEVCTGEEIGVAKEILEKMIKKSVVKSKSWMPREVCLALFPVCKQGFESQSLSSFTICLFKSLYSSSLSLSTSLSSLSSL